MGVAAVVAAPAGEAMERLRRALAELDAQGDRAGPGGWTWGRGGHDAGAE